MERGVVNTHSRVRHRHHAYTTFQRNHYTGSRSKPGKKHAPGGGQV